MVLVSASILLVWANRTLIDTPTYVATVGPVLRQPQLQDYVANQVTSQLLTTVSTGDLAEALLSPAQVAGQSPAQIQALVTPVIHQSVVQILQSPKIQALWVQTNQTDHAAFVSQLNSGAAAISITMTPLVTGVENQLAQTKLAPVAAHMNLASGPAVVQLTGAPLDRVRTYYHLLATATWVVVGLAVLFLGLSVWTSVHHAKTLRRILISTGVSALTTAAVIFMAAGAQLPGSDPLAARLAVAISGVLLHGLAVGCAVLGIVCLAAAGGSKWYSRAHP